MCCSLPLPFPRPCCLLRPPLESTTRCSHLHVHSAIWAAGQRSAEAAAMPARAGAYAYDPNRNSRPRTVLRRLRPYPASDRSRSKGRQATNKRRRGAVRVPDPFRPSHATPTRRAVCGCCGWQQCPGPTHARAGLRRQQGSSRRRLLASTFHHGLQPPADEADEAAVGRRMPCRTRGQALVRAPRALGRNRAHWCRHA